MASPGKAPKGQIRKHARTDGGITYSLRVRAHGERYTVRLGDEEDGWSERRAEIELANTIAKINAGIWEPPDRSIHTPHLQPTMHEFASMWLRRKKGEGIRPNTIDDYTWRLSKHLLPFFGRLRPGQITEGVVEEYVDLKIAEREEVLRTAAAGEVLRDRNDRVRRPLSNASINAQLVTLAVILDGAVKRGWLAANPARGGHRGCQPQPRRHRPCPPQTPRGRRKDRRGHQGSADESVVGSGAQRLLRVAV